MDIIDGLYRYLRSKTALTDLLGTGDSFKIFPEIAAQNTQLPYVIMTLPDKEEYTHLGGADEIGDWQLTFEIYSNSVSERTSIQTALRNVLHTRRNVVLTDVNSNTALMSWSSKKHEYSGMKSPPDGKEDEIMCLTVNYECLIYEALPTLP